MADNAFAPGVVTASDTVDMKAGFFSRVGDAITKGIPLAAYSGAMSIYNTGLDYFGKEAEDVALNIRRYDAQMGDYYDENKEIVDLTGFVATSLIPGGLGIGALKLARSGQALGAVGRYLNIAATPAQANLTRGLQAMARSGGLINAEVKAARNARLLWETADQVILSSAAELAIVATMNDSPIFENDTWGDFAGNILTGALFGGAIGGVFSAVETRGILKAAGRTIEGGKREFDSVFDPAKYGLKKADEIAIFTENLLKLPENFYSAKFDYRLGGKKQSIYLDTADAFQSARTSAEKAAETNIKLKFNELADNNETTGQALYEFIFRQIDEGRKAGHDAATISDTVRGYLQGTKKFSSLEIDSGSIEPPKQFFVNLKPTGLMDALVTTKMPGKTGKQAYYLTTTDPRQIKAGTLANLGLDNSDEAFEMGYDAVYNAQGKLIINPKSKVIVKTPDAALKNDFYLDMESGSLTNDVILTGGDLLKRKSDFKAFPEAAWVGGKQFQQAASKAFDLADSALNASVRFMWAGSEALSDSAFTRRTIAWNDFPLLDRAKTITRLNTEGETAILMPDGSKVKFTEIVGINEFVNELKLRALQEGLDAGKPYDVRHIQSHLNVTRKWFDDAVANNFSTTPNLLEEARDLNSFYRPSTVKVQWDDEAVQVLGPGKEFVGPAHMSNYVLGHHYEMQTNKMIHDTAFQAAFGEDAKGFMDAAEQLIKGVTSQGAGAGTISFSNADYGDGAKLFVQDVGKATQLVQQKWRDRDIMALSSHVNAVRDNKNAAAELGVLTTALRTDSAKYYLDTQIGGSSRLVDRDAFRLMEKNPNDFADLDEAIQYLVDNGKRGQYKITNDVVADFFEASRDINRSRLEKKTTLLNAAGLGREIDADIIYAPPVDTRRYPFFAYVVSKERVGSITDVRMVTAKSEEQLRTLTGKVGDDYEVVFKTDTEKYRKAKGMYDYDSTINESRIDADLQRRGVALGDYYPETRAQNVLEDYVNWHGQSSDALVRLGVEVKNRQFVSELDFLSQQYTKVSTSTFAGRGPNLTKIADPFGDYKKTMLNISKTEEYPILDALNEFTDRVSKNLYSKLDQLRQGVFDPTGKNSFASLEETNKLMADAGLGTPYSSIEELLVANEKYPRNIVKDGVQKVNYWLATTTLRLDLANSIVNLISTPIMLGTELSSIRHLIGQDSDLAGKLRELTHMQVPGAEYSIPSSSRLIGTAIKNYFGPEKAALLTRYVDNGDIKGISTLYHEVLDSLAYRPGEVAGKWSERISAAVEKGSKISGANFAEELSRFISADVMRQLSQPVVDAGKMTVKEQNAYISSFVNRVQGNYIYSQRPVAFQGTVGSAISLFQTYSFNVGQQLLRHMENGDKKTLAIFAGLQSTLYGMNGLPMFDAINTHLIGSAAGNPEHKDLYGTIAGSEMGNWMMYGTASAFPLFGPKAPALFSRGDINPRHVTILPTNPMDVPAVQASLKLVDTLWNFGKNVANGADMSASMLQAVEHQGWSRPLAGFAQLLQGKSTTTKGSLVSAANDLEATTFLAKIPERLINFGSVARLMGSRPMDEAMSLNSLYRIKSYDAMDRNRIEALGQAVKTKLGNNQMPDDEEMQGFMQDYINSGGRQETFSASMQRWSRDSNQSIVNQMANKMGNPTYRQLQNLLGGSPLQDYNTIATEPPPTPAE